MQEDQAEVGQAPGWDPVRDQLISKGEPREPAPLARAMDALDAELGNIETALGQVVDRVSPLVAQQPRQPETTPGHPDGQPPAGSSPVVGRIWVAAGRASTIAGALRELRGSLEV